MKLSFIILLSCLLLSCIQSVKKKNVDNVILNRYDFYNQDSIVNVDTLALLCSEFKDSINYLYKFDENEEAYFHLVKYSSRDKNSIIIYDIACPLIYEKEISINNKTYKILKYDFDIKESSDEETCYLFCQEYGLLVVDNYTFYGLVYSFEYDSISKRIVNQILQHKSEYGITDYSIEPPMPSGMDSLQKDSKQ